MDRIIPLAWRHVAICFVLLACQGMIAGTYSIIAVPLGAEYQPSRAVLMLSMTVMSGVCAILMPFIGALMDRMPLRRMMIAGGLMLGAGYAAISLTTAFYQVLLIFGLIIAPGSVMLGPVAATVLLTRWFRDKRGRAMGIAIAGIAAGVFTFPFIIQGLLDSHQWREALLLLGLILAVVTVSTALLVVDRPPEDDAPSGIAGLGNANVASHPISAMEVLRDPAFWLIAVTVAIVTAGMKGTVTNLVPLATDTGVTATDAAKLISVYAACSFLSKLSFAWFSDRLGPRTLMFISLGGFAMGMGCLTFAANGPAFIAAGVGLIGLFGGMMIPLESYVVPLVFGPRAVGRAMGLLSGTILLALLATPPLFGLMFDLTGTYKSVFWAFSGLALAALLWVPAIRLHRRDVAG